MATAGPNLEGACLENGFRSDLYYRLAVLQARVPPLRERPNEIEPLMRAFWSGGRRWPRVSPEAWNVWREHSWRGNLVELRSLTERLEAMGAETVDETTARRLLGTSERPEPLDLDRERVRTEMEIIRQAIHDCSGNKAEAARLLGISRGTLYNKLRKADELEHQ
jgi:DNA-binding NtrC family response regulator